MSKSIVVYYSMSGNVEWAARQVAGKLGAELLSIAPKKEYPSEGFKKFFWGGKSAMMGEQPPLVDYEFADGYDLVVLACPVWASRIAPPLRTFICDNLAALQGKKLALALCYSGGGADKAIERASKKFDLTFADTLVLVDPKDKPAEANEEAIDAFCRRLAEQ